MTGAWTDLLGQDLVSLERAGRARPVVQGLSWGEGPAQLDDGSWVFSDIPNNAEYHWRPGEPPTRRSPANFANGHSVRRNGRLLSCEHGTRSVVEIDRTGRRTVVASHFQAGRLNSPNDVIEAGDRSIWFTDPTYGIMSDLEGYRADPEQDRNRVYRYGDDGVLTAEIDHLVQPNGLCFSLDRSQLYVADSGAERGPGLGFDPEGPRCIWRFELREGRVHGRGTILAEVGTGVPDGLRTDRSGNIWAATGAGLEAFSADGRRLGLLGTPEVASNMCGSKNGNEMLVTLATSAWLLTI